VQATVGSQGFLRLKIVVMFPFWHYNQRIFEIYMPRLLLTKPYLMEGLTRDAASQVGMELLTQFSVETQNART
jgi:hypothetical protein